MATLITPQPSKNWNGGTLARLLQQTGAVLKQVEAIPGVKSALVCDNHGALLAAWMAEVLERSALEEAGLYVAQVLAGLEVHGDKPKEMEIHFERASILARDLGNAFEAIWCAPTANAAMLRMAMNVAAAPFEKDGELQNALRNAAPARTDTLGDDHLDAETQRWARRMRRAT